MPEFKEALRTAHGNDTNIGFNGVAGYTRGLTVRKALAPTPSMTHGCAAQGAIRSLGQQDHA